MRPATWTTTTSSPSSVRIHRALRSLLSAALSRAALPKPPLWYQRSMTLPSVGLRGEEKEGGEEGGGEPQRRGPDPAGEIMRRGRGAHDQRRMQPALAGEDG